ncbi:alanine racemase [Thioalkalivibrio sp. AKL17]|uniref:alanine racemase n=1 Tax=Thioalkalivibrio sp. AKL17 TaxID=1158160 RepID=UPI000376FBE4|nr:alanine racemase [Thioalkalivibrio sp. AKL17]
MQRAASIQLDSGALRHNLEVARGLAPEVAMWPVIKAEGYGHGLDWAAQSLGEVADGLAVSAVEEAEVLRRSGFDGPLLVLQGGRDSAGLRRCAELALQPAVHAPAQLEALDAASVALPEVWIKLNTGMNRLGFAPAQADAVERALRAAGHGGRGLHWMTHMACADDPADDHNAAQLSAFATAVAGRSGARSLANSASLFAGWGRGVGHGADEAFRARPGIMLYGCHPASVPAETPPEGPHADLRPVMTVQAPIIGIQHPAPGDGVGYGATWTAHGGERIGIVAMGYADGYPRHAPTGTPVRVRGQLCPLVGRVSMDMLAVDLSDVPEAAVGDLATLWGEGLPVERVARAAGTIGYELLTRVAGRLRPA